MVKQPYEGDGIEEASVKALTQLISDTLPDRLKQYVAIDAMEYQSRRTDGQVFGLKFYLRNITAAASQEIISKLRCMLKISE